MTTLGKPDLVDVKMETAQRLGCSVNGNPRYAITLTNGATYLTQSDGACSYEVTNYLNAGTRFDAWLTRAGRISYIEAHR